MNVTRRAGFWIALTLLGVGGAAAARAFFPVAFPTVAVELEMDRAAAIAAAGELARRYGWGEPDDRSAATFGVADRETQTYVELAGGGLEALERLAERGLYEPYQWRVRRFAEGRIEEVEVRFTPAGEPYGFELRLADDDPGEGNLDARAARALAEATATAWGIELVDYRLLESSEASLPSGRLDHELVFERTGETLGDARFRLRVRIAGERPAELTRFVFVPEAFSRRYADTRATNDAIGLAATTVYVLLFVLLGGGVGSALLLRRGWLEWRAPLRWGVVIATLLGLAQINGLPLAWMAYDTALSETSFVLQQLGAGVVVVLLGAPFVAFILMAGESLGRRAFPGHVRQWRFWSREVAASRTALGMTSAAYLLVGMQLGYVVLFYVTTRRLEGWWSPAEALVQPDLLATYLPWLQAVSLALFAAFWEESAFRAVPIACAALLGARFGKRGLWIAAAVVLQAVVFAAAHANYPQQPPYARVVELTLPALVWGCVYVAVGLVPTILAHFLYDLVLISLVLFASDARLDQAVIVLVGLAPLAVVLIARLRGPATARPPEWAYNRAWVPWRAREEAEPAGGVPAGPEPGDAPAAAPTAPAPGGVVPAPAAPAPHAPRREGPAALGARRAVAVA
ncbi:MAG TPA: CPBP family glutamic-type intramembrane protease, partial [Longimicrobiales bacterium]|nr:CPBP family glutamic-type intramembrane protease [Longimicrobiales bacterium]